jgi:hypothetical protein
MRVLVPIILAVIPMLVHAEDAVDIENQKIDYLIASIESLQNAEFIRNGKDYNAKNAADHLRLKRRKARSRIKTADDFIRYCATASSMSGEPYQIRFADGTLVFTGEYLRRKIAEFGAKP